MLTLQTCIEMVQTHDHDLPSHLKINEEIREITPQLSLSEFAGPE
jgi:hypothetical protein